MGPAIDVLPANPSDWLVGRGEMADRIRSFDWSTKCVGPPEQWPQSLKTAVQILVGSRYPMFLWWGESLINFYNDAYAPMLGIRHPTALGAPAFEVWADVWPICGPQAEAVLERGESSWNEELLLVMERKAFVEEAYFTFSYSPVTDDTGRPRGVFCAVTEETARVLSRRRLKTLRELGERALLGAKTDMQACQAAAHALEGNQNDVPFALIYLLDQEAHRCRLCAAINCPPGQAASPREVVLAEKTDIWGFQGVLRAGQTQLVDDLRTRFGRLPAGPWNEDWSDQAFVLPLAKAGVQETPAGFLVTGLSPRLEFTEEYRGFLELAAGHIATAIANARAYQEERQRAEALAELDRAKTTFFHNVSHEFRTPLTLMLGPLEELLNRQAAPGPEERRQLQTVHRNSLRLLKLVNTLLDFSRLEAGRIQANYEPVDLAKLTRELASAFESAMQKAGLGYEIECPSLEQPVFVDRDMWEKIVFNLLSNAFKFTPSGSVSIRLRPEPETVVLRVCDTGAGIPEQEIPNLFTRFHRVQNVVARANEGTGIGLALVYELVKLHGGTVSVESRLGRGSVFTVRIPWGKGHLPAERIGVPPQHASTALHRGIFVEEALRWLPADEKNTGRAAASLAGPLAVERSRVLVAEDNADMRDYICRLLDKRYEVCCEPDGAAALASAGHRRPDLVLTDVMMPRLDGLGLLRAIRADPDLKTVPVILLSARAGDEARTEGLEHGADDYLVKPFSGRELLARVETHLNLARFRRETADREKKLRLEVQAAKERLDSVLSSIEELFLILDADWRFLYVNERVREVTGLSTEGLLGRRIWEMFPDTDTGPFHDELLKAAAERRPAHFESFHASWNRWFENRVYPTPEGLAVLATDITRRRQVGEALRQSAERQNSLFSLVQAVNQARALPEIYEAALEAIFQCTGATRASIRFKDADGIMRFQAWRYFSDEYRQAVATHSPWDPEESAPQPICFSRPADFPADVRTILQREGVGALAYIPITWERLLVGKFTIGYDQPHHLALEELRLVQTIATQLGFAVHRQRTAEKLERLVQERTAKLQDMVGELRHISYAITHDMRAPLRAMNAFADTILEETSRVEQPSPAVREACRRIMMSSARLDKLIQDSLNYTKLALKEVPLRPVNLSLLVPELIESYPNLQPHKHRIRISDPLPIVSGEESLLTQCFSNLLGNAVKFVPAGVQPDVAITCALHERTARITIKDNGIGIPAHAQKRLFTMFQRLTSEYEGTGIGLAIVHKVVERMGGKVGVESVPGQGSSFWVELGVQPEPEAKQKAVPPTKPDTTNPGPVLLA